MKITAKIASAKMTRKMDCTTATVVNRPSSREEPRTSAPPRNDTVALVEKNASKPREVQTWLAVVAIVALSLVAGLTTYLVRMRMTADAPTPTVTADGRGSNPASAR